MVAKHHGSEKCGLEGKKEAASSQRKGINWHRKGRWGI
jgi:hypothetical protein